MNAELTITRTLSRDEQQNILNALFGFNFINCGGDHFVLHDEDGNEFYGITANCNFDFSTLAGIFSYTAHNAKNQGYEACQSDFKKVLGL